MAYNEEDDDRPRGAERLSPAKMSKTPSWIMLGFLLGALFVWALPRRPKPAAVVPAIERRDPVPPAAPRPELQLTTIEAVFDREKERAVWAYGTTEVALWNPHDRAFSDFYEVVRYGGTYYFRSIPKLTRLIINRGKDGALRFTETPEQYEEWQKHGRTERSVESGLLPRPDASPVDRR